MRRPKLGYRQLPDPRDAGFPLSSAMRGKAGLPFSKVWKPGDHQNQLDTNGCVGFSTYQYQASEPITKEPMLSALQIYAEARKNDEFPGEGDEGTSVRAGLEVLKAHRIISAYYWAEGAADAIEYMLRKPSEGGGPLVLGIRWTDSMFNPDANGFVKPAGRTGGGHAIFCYAAHWKGKYVTLRNSWGKEWGKKGDCRLAFTDLDRLLQEGGVAAGVIEHLP